MTENNKYIEWMNKSGVYLPQKTPEDRIVKYLSISNISDITINDLEDAIITLSTYHYYITFLVNRQEAKIKKLQSDLNKIIYMVDSSNNNYWTKKDKAISKNIDAQKINDELESCNIKYNLIKNLPESVHNLIFSLKKIYEKRIKEINK